MPTASPRPRRPLTPASCQAVIEDIDVKNKLYTELGQIAKPSAVFASNTSSLRISQMAPASGREDKMVRDAAHVHPRLPATRLGMH